MRSLKSRITALFTRHRKLAYALLPYALLFGISPSASAAGTTDVANSMVRGICGLIGPLVGSHSQFLSLIFLISLGVIFVLWWLNENKEGLVTWALRTGLALAVLINLVTLPQLVGLDPINCTGVI